MEATTAQANDLERRVDLSIAISNVEKEMEQRLKRMGKNMKMNPILMRLNIEIKLRLLLIINWLIKMPRQPNSKHSACE